jgi:hypothetical protein
MRPQTCRGRPAFDRGKEKSPDHRRQATLNDSHRIVLSVLSTVKLRFVLDPELGVLLDLMPFSFVRVTGQSYSLAIGKVREESSGSGGCAE